MIENDGLSEAEEELFFESETYAKLSDESTLLYLKPWQDTYVMAKLEIEKNRQKEKDIDGLSLS